MPDLTENELREKIRELNNKAWSGEMTIAEAKTLNRPRPAAHGPGKDSEEYAK